MSFFDKQLNNLKDKITGSFNPFDGKGIPLGGIGNLIDSAIDGVVDTLDNVFDSVSGIFKPQFDTKQEAEDSLFNSQPEPIPRGTIYESSIQDAENMRSPNDPLHIRNFVRQSFRIENMTLVYIIHMEQVEKQLMVLCRIILWTIRERYIEVENCVG